MVYNKKKIRTVTIWIGSEYKITDDNETPELLAIGIRKGDLVSEVPEKIMITEEDDGFMSVKGVDKILLKEDY